VLGGGIKLDDVMKSKMENDAAAFMRSFVAKRGRNVEAAESAVRESKSFTEQEALDKKIIDVVARDTSDLFKQLDGREITRFNGTKQKLQLANVKIVNFDPTMREKVLSVLMNPGVTFLLFSLGMMFIYFEFNHPGGVIPGVVGVVLVLLSIFALNILPTRFAALGLIIGAFVLFALEVKFTSHGLLGLGGTVMMVIGALLLVDGPIPELRVGLITALAVSLPLSAITIFLMSLAYRAHKNKVTTGEEGMIGLIGEARTPLTPSGKIFVNGELWNAIASAPVEAGQAVVVKRIDGLNLQVEPAFHTNREQH
jgi:membrane-bound serine protease (ClpP class)